MSWRIIYVYHLNDIAVLNIKDTDYRCIIDGISRRDAVNLLKNADLTEKRGGL